MASHTDVGRQGEKLAEQFLLANGFAILHRNWRFSHYEIDLIAMKKNIPHFIEVKFRSSHRHGFPEESVTRKKLRFLLQAVDAFLYRHQQYRDFQVDILSILLVKGKPEYLLIEDVYQ